MQNVQRRADVCLEYWNVEFATSHLSGKVKFMKKSSFGRLLLKHVARFVPNVHGRCRWIDVCLEYRNVAVDLRTVSLGDTFCDPDDVAVFLFTEFHIRVEDAEMELVHERLLH